MLIFLAILDRLLNWFNIPINGQSDGSIKTDE